MLLLPIVLAAAFLPAQPIRGAADAQAALPARFDESVARQMEARIWPRDVPSLRAQLQTELAAGRMQQAAEAAAMLCARAGESCRDAERLAGAPGLKRAVFVRRPL